MPRAWQELRKQLFLISSVLLLFAVHVRKKEEGLPLGDPIVMGLSPGRRAWGWPPPRTVGTSAKWLLGSRKTEGKCCLKLFDLGGGAPAPAVEGGVWAAGSRPHFLCPLPIVSGTDVTLSPSIPPPPSLSVLTCSQGRAAFWGARGSFLPSGVTLHPPGRPPCVG